jgi:hypothetical protein
MGYLETALAICRVYGGPGEPLPEESLEPRALTRHKSPAPDPLDALRGPRRTPWGTLAWSDPEAPPIELFGPPPARDLGPGPAD